MKQFKWPIKKPLTSKLKDFLEDKVDEKYYLSQDKIDKISAWNAQQKPFEEMKRSEKRGYFGTLTTRDGDEQSGMKLIQEKIKKEKLFGSFQQENVVTTKDDKHIPTLTSTGAFSGHKILESIPIKEATKKGFKEAHAGDGVYVEHINGKRGTVQKDMIQTIKTQPDIGVVVNDQGVEIEINKNEDGRFGTIKNSKYARDTAKRVYSETHPTIQTKDAGDNIIESNSLRIRKITPREALRLMGLNDKRIDLIQESEMIPHNKQYFIAGNSIVVQVLEGIFANIDFPKDRPLKVFETFAGYGSQSIALENLGYELDAHTSEWFVDAIIAYALIHHNDRFYNQMFVNKGPNWNKEQLLEQLKPWTLSTDSKKPNDLKRKSEEELHAILAANQVNENKGSILDIKGEDLDKYDLLTYSFPCQDLSLAGKGKGMQKGSGTRSGLLWEIERILLELKEEDKLPRVLLMENVPQVHGKDNLEDFNKWQQQLMDLGYKNTWKDLNAKDFGVPQNRNRTFMVSILDGDVEEESTVQIGLF